MEHQKFTHPNVLLSKVDTKNVFWKKKKPPSEISCCRYLNSICLSFLYFVSLTFLVCNNSKEMMKKEKKPIFLHSNSTQAEFLAVVNERVELLTFFFNTNRLYFYWYFASQQQVKRDVDITDSFHQFRSQFVHNTAHLIWPLHHFYKSSKLCNLWGADLDVKMSTQSPSKNINKNVCCDSGEVLTRWPPIRSFDAKSPPSPLPCKELVIRLVE